MPERLVAGDQITVEAEIVNVGDAPGSYRAVLKVNGKEIDTREVTIAGGGQETVSFVYVFETPGSANLEIGGTKVTVKVLEPAQSMVAGETVRGTIDLDFDTDIWIFTSSGRQTVTIAMDAVNESSLDPFVVLLDTDGIPVGSDDDGGGAPNALLETELVKSGTYRVIAGGIGPSHGNYSLSLTVSPVVASSTFAIVVLPDTQKYVWERAKNHPGIFTAQTEWIAAHKDLYKIVFVLHEGDIVQDNNDIQWQMADKSMSILDGVVPYALAPGNHDMGTGGKTDTRDTMLLNTYFPVSRFETLPTFGGVFEPGKLDNSFHIFSAGGTDWLVLALEFGPRDQVLDWANQVVAEHPDRRVIVVTHTYLYNDDTLHGSDPTQEFQPREYGVADGPGGVNDGVAMWNNLIRRHRNITFVLSGHIGADGAGRLVSTGDNGNKVYQLLANYQSWPIGGSGFLRLMEFDPGQKRVSVKTYSPYVDAYKTDPENQFVLENVYLGPPDITPPTAPTNLRPAPFSGSQIGLTWTAASDPESGISSYIIYLEGAQVGTSDTTTYSGVGLSRATAYTYDVSAVNGDGLEGSKSASTTGASGDGGNPDGLAPPAGGGEPVEAHPDITLLITADHGLSSKSRMVGLGVAPPREKAAARFELHYGRLGDIIVSGERGVVFGDPP